MGVTARVAVLPRAGTRLEILELDIPEPAQHQVVIEQFAFGVCHSQLARIFDRGRAAPLLLGHEAMGRVTAVGESVTYVVPGDVVYTTWIPRRTLGERAARPCSLPLPGGEVATTHNTFTWGTHSIFDEQYVVKAAPGVDIDLGTVIGCAVMTGAGAVLNSVKLDAGQSVAVWGAGGVGLCAVAGAHAKGAGRLIAVDINDDKLTLAREFGATDVVNARETDPVERIRELTQHDDGTTGVDFSFDCTGVGDNVRVSLAAVRPGIRGLGVRGGTDVLVGIPRAPFQLESFDLLEGEKSLTGSVGGSSNPERDFAIFAEWARDGRFDAARLVTDRFELDEINEAVAALHDGQVLGRAVVHLQDVGR